MLNQKLIFTTLACASFFSLSACTSHSVAQELSSEEGLSVSEIYHSQMTNEPFHTPHLSAKPVDYAGYTREAANETASLFKPLDNPSIPLFVYPHVALIGDEQLLKPGYTTAFFLYKQNQFALASEHY